MASPISPMEAIQIAQKVVDLYQKIKHDVPEQVEKVGKRMQRLKIYLEKLKELLDNKQRHALASLRHSEADQLRTIITEARDYSKEIYAILEKWDKNIGPFGLQLQFPSVAQALFAIGSSPGRLEKLGEQIDEAKEELRDFLQLMGAFAMNQLLLNAQQPQGNLRPRSPLPTPRTSGKTSIIFIDPHNLGRSVVAEAYMNLVQEWTTRSGGNWPVGKIHSAGIRVKTKSDAAETLQSLKPPVAMATGNYTPLKTALDSLFDNHLFNYAFKPGIREKFNKHTSRGINHSLFSTYDLIVVFTSRDFETSLNFKRALRKKFGYAIAPMEKGRVVLLGSYLPGSGKNGRPKEIPDAPKNKSGGDDRANWNKTTSDLKVGIKSLLKTELSWAQPAKGAKMKE